MEEEWPCPDTTDQEVYLDKWLEPVHVDTGRANKNKAELGRIFFGGVCQTAFVLGCDGVRCTMNSPLKTLSGFDSHPPNAFINENGYTSVTHSALYCALKPYFTPKRNP
ncbi:hypothetical protein JTE90_027371 [Oedothorax gibbosus]|uniref:Uncharacterized protein n=1 Tax=Oedothorax gibbosus TaxID=931172 RepID=A0AAV6VZ41_9ARAC|nr:hypothetical protein JTE90_027371 [Oedothorax gibbosus]